MINKNNYFEKVSQIGYDSLPEALKEGFDTVKFGTKDYSTWEFMDDDKEFLDIYFNKLNSFIKDEPKTEPDNNNEDETPSSDTENEKEEKEGKKEKTKKERDKKAVKTEKKPKVKEQKIEPVGVERIDEEVKFIKRYILLNKQEKNKTQILQFINALQKAIIEKRIRKTSNYAKEIMHIQQQIVELYNKMPEVVTVEIASDTLEKYSIIANSEKTLLSVNYIKRYLSIHGKEDVEGKATFLINQLKRAANKKKLVYNDPYAKKLETIFTSLNNYIEGKTKTPTIETAELNGLLGMVGDKIKIVKKKRKK